MELILKKTKTKLEPAHALLLETEQPFLLRREEDHPTDI